MKNRLVPKSGTKSGTEAKASPKPKLRTRDILDAVESINAVAALKLPVRTSFAVALNLKAVKDAVDVFQAQRKKILDEHTLKDADGKPLPAYAPVLGEDGKPRMDKDGRPEVVKDDKGVIINKVLEGQVQLDDPKAFQADVQELLDVDITDDVHIKPVKLSALSGALEPQHFVNILWMINDDTEASAS